LAQENGGGGGQRLWWREEVAEASVAAAARGAEVAPVQAQAATEPIALSVLHAPVLDADHFDTLWDELEAEAVRRTDDVQAAIQARHTDALSAVTVPLQLNAIIRRDRETSRRNYRALMLLFGVMSALMIAVLLTAVFSGSKFPSVLISNLVVFLVNLNLQWQTNKSTQKRLGEWEARDDWRIAIGRAGLTVVTPWANEGKEEVLPWNLIHDIKTVTLPGKGVRERFFCVVRRDGLDNNGEPVAPQPEDALSRNEKRRLAWRRFLSKEPPAPKLPPPIMIPESALPLSADALVARIAVWEAGQADAKS